MVNADGQLFGGFIVPLLDWEEQYQFRYLVREALGVLEGDRVEEEEMDETRDDVPPGRVADGVMFK